jgi:hypothetical protein
MADQAVCCSHAEPTAEHRMLNWAPLHPHLRPTFVCRPAEHARLPSPRRRLAPAGWPWAGSPSA